MRYYTKHLQKMLHLYLKYTARVRHESVRCVVYLLTYLLTYIHTYIHTYLLTYLLIYLLHGA